MFLVPDLPYGYGALEPYIDEQTMRLHHDKHHVGYVTKLNDALKGNDEFLGMDVHDVIKNLDRLPEDIRTIVGNNGGGHANHSLFWTVMKPGGGGKIKGDLQNAVDEVFGGQEAFEEAFGKAAAGIFGSGWAWLVLDNGRLIITTTPNQDSPLMKGQIPILGLDVWEHAYYLRYQNKRPEYIDAWWHVVNWDEVGRRFEEAKNA